MDKVIRFLDHMKKQTKEYRRLAIRKKLIEFYQSHDNGTVSIPAFQLADLHIKRIENEEGIDYWYKRLKEAGLCKTGF